MTAKQRAARAKFKAIVKEAGKLRKKNPKLTQAEAVKQAWAISYGKKRAGVGAVKKKTATKVKAKKRKTTEQHTDTKSHNVNIRVVSGIKKKNKIGSSYLDRLKEKEAQEYREREILKREKERPAVASKRIKTVLKKQGLKMPHGYKITSRKSIGALPTYKDPDAAREIELYADNDSQLYYQSRKPILKNLASKYKKGTFDVEKAAKLWKYYIEAAMKKYHKEFGSRGDKWSDLLNVHDRLLLANEYAINTKAEFDLGNLPE